MFNSIAGQGIYFLPCYFIHQGGNIMHTALMIPTDQQQSFLPVGTTDDMLINMWMNSKHSTNTKDAYVRDIQQSLGFVRKPLQAITLKQISLMLGLLKNN
jgi:hypothetical protein